MSFYTSPLFFIVLVVAIVPAAILGFTGRRIRLYGFCASAVFLLLLFLDTPLQLGIFLGFVALSTICFKVVQHNFGSGEGSVPLYRVCLLLAILPLAASKVLVCFEINALGFIGISYVTFKSVQVLIEIRDGLIKDLSLLDYLYFLLFFPVFTSGPIDRSRRFMEDSRKMYSKSEYGDLLSRGILLLLVGAVFQFALATLALKGYNTHAILNSPSLLWGLITSARVAWAYGLYLFFNFAGYSLMAMGASYCFGIRTPRNFRAPFAATDMKDFWNRWHMTLSFWLRDFVFMRVVKSLTKRKVFKSRVNTACCGYMANMVLMGAWHGLTVDYLLYGLYHGLLLGLTEVVQKKSKLYKRFKKELWFKCLSWIVTLNLVMFGFALFSGEITTIVGGFFNG